jgi:hypothetical protein
LYGTVTIDTATGKALSADLEIKVPGIVFDKVVSTHVIRFTQAGQSVQYVEIAIQGIDKYLNEGAWLYLVIPSPSLVGYEGGPLVGRHLPRGPFTYLVLDWVDPYYLYWGTLEPQ